MKSKILSVNLNDTYELYNDMYDQCKDYIDNIDIDPFTPEEVNSLFDMFINVTIRKERN